MNPISSISSTAKVIIFLVIGTGLSLMFWYTAKASGKNKQKVKDAEKTAELEKRLNEQVPFNGDNVRKSYNPDGLAAKLHETMDGIDWGMANTDKEDAFKELAHLSDDEIKVTYNRFNAMYGAEKKGTLYQWIYDENGNQGKIIALAALERLGLK